MYIHKKGRMGDTYIIIKTESQNHCINFKNNTLETKERTLSHLLVRKSEAVKSRARWLSSEPQRSTQGGTPQSYGVAVGSKTLVEALQGQLCLPECPTVPFHLPVSFCNTLTCHYQVSP